MAIAYDDRKTVCEKWRLKLLFAIALFNIAIESMNLRLRKLNELPRRKRRGIKTVNQKLRRSKLRGIGPKEIKPRGAFPTDEAAIKLLYLGLRNIGKRGTMPIQNWKQAMSQLMIRFDKQFNPA